jgi:hypothetical protein
MAYQNISSRTLMIPWQSSISATNIFVLSPFSAVTEYEQAVFKFLEATSSPRFWPSAYGATQRGVCRRKWSLNSKLLKLPGNRDE